MTKTQYPDDAAVRRVDAAMQGFCEPSAAMSQNDPLGRALAHHLASGGGRMRARLALGAAAALDLQRSDAEALAAAVELLHNASLIQDDLQDKDEHRRGQLSVWRRFGQNVAIGLTDVMIAAGFAAAASVSRSEIVPLLVNKLHFAIARTVHGQAADLGCAEEITTLEACLAVAGNKSGPLFALGLELPLIAAGLDRHTERAQAAAHAFGIGYQLADDMFDVERDRLGGTVANAVLVLQRSMGRSAARAEARRIAVLYLASASRLGSALPGACGSALTTLAERLTHRLEGGAHV